MIAPICHGVGGLLNVKHPDGEYLIKGKSMTGFNWFKEAIARRKKKCLLTSKQLLKKEGQI